MPFVSYGGGHFKVAARPSHVVPHTVVSVCGVRAWLEPNLLLTLTPAGVGSSGAGWLVAARLLVQSPGSS